MKYIQCGFNQSIYQAVEEEFGPDFRPVVDGMGTSHPEVPGMVGIVTVRPRESFAVVRHTPTLLGRKGNGSTA